MSNFSVNISEFNNLKNSLLLQKEWTCLEFDKTFRNKTLLDGKRYNYHLLFVDKKGYLIRESDNELKTFLLKNDQRDCYYFTYNELRINRKVLSNDWEYCFDVSNREIGKINKYISDFCSYEDLFLESLEHTKKRLIEMPDLKSMIIVFFERYMKNLFKAIDFVDYLEEDLLATMFLRKMNLNKNYGFYFGSNHKEEIFCDYNKLLDLLFHKGIIDKSFIDDKEKGYLLIISILKDIAIELLSKEFEESYGGYFPSLKEMSFDECIASYYQIDFLEHESDQSISYFTYFLYTHKPLLVPTSDKSIFGLFVAIKDKVKLYGENIERNAFELSLRVNNKKKNGVSDKFEHVTMDDVDFMSGTEFEEFIYDLFKKMGYSVNLTPSSGDQGIDIVAVKNGLRIGIQTKCYSNSVSNKAIQEVVAGVKHYQLSKAIVITNNFFTKSAIALAQSNDVVLWDRSMLEVKINDFYK
ncbi:restriction endonuclease [Anaerobacillus arseniciselenatis]|nr:restriction endonuclease [Anaerobacillus arseniciselenatis]